MDVKKIKANGWDNHEESFEEVLRREMLAAREELWIVKEDLRQSKKYNYELIIRLKRLTKEKTKLQDELRRIK